MPFQEQGVEVDGFHEERTEDDETRERRACPSGERQVSCCMFVKLKKESNKNKKEVVTLKGTTTLFSIWDCEKWLFGV